MPASNDLGLPTPLSDVETMDDFRNRLRAVYSQAFSDIMDHILEDVILPDVKASILLDAAQFMTFLMAVKLTEVRGQAPTRENLLAAYWPMQKALKDEVPDQLRAFAAEVIGSSRKVS